MRKLLLMTILSLIAVAASAEVPSSTILWEKPFQTRSESAADKSLILILVTNDDPFDVDAGGWAGELIEEPIAELAQQRMGFAERVTTQFLPAGIPSVLTAGESRNVPARAIVAICNRDYRLLSFCVGIPDTDELVTLIEDAEEVQTLAGIHQEAPKQLIRELAERSADRVGRRWQQWMVQAVTEIENNPADEAAADRIARVVPLLEQSYLAESQLRFGLSDPEDATRLGLLEQHVCTRQPWCDSIMPLVANADFRQHYRKLIQPIWGHPLVNADADAAEVIDWAASQSDHTTAKKEGVFVLLLQSPIASAMAPIQEEGDGKNEGKQSRVAKAWDRVAALVAKFPNREVDLQQLALLSRAQQWPAIDIQRPSIARYIFVDAQKPTPLVVHLTDSPGRFASVLQRSKPSSLANLQPDQEK
ncbi:hypothetical protein [Novipirellula caenicola]|uniref:Secreted protein n=1 Tax=Novipirellula caenicola TaxID=1536901 RepID=A0ABP9VNK7_9BACT